MRGKEKPRPEVKVSLSDVTRCAVCKRVLAVVVKVETSNGELPDYHVLRIEDYKLLEVVRQPLPAGNKEIVLCEHCYGWALSFLNDVRENIKRKAQVYDVKVSDAYIDKILVFSDVREVYRFLENEARWITTPRLDYVTFPEDGRKVYCLAFEMAPRHIPKDAKTYPLLRVCIPVEELLLGL